MKVLIADDDLLVRYTLEMLMGERGHTVQAVRDGGETILALSQELPDILILDLLMPVKTGYDVLRWLVANDTDRRTQVIILSAFVVEADGFDRHPHVACVLQKPVVLSQLDTAIEHCRERLCQPV